MSPEDYAVFEGLKHGEVGSIDLIEHLCNYYPIIDTPISHKLWDLYVLAYLFGMESK